MSECSCKQCASACSFTPGWFLPGEAELAAKLKGMTLKDFFDNYLGVNWWEGSDDRNVFLLAPAIDSMSPGDEYPGDPKGRCVFLVGGKCDIHDAKPYECREYIHSDTRTQVQARHASVVDKWRDAQHQKQIEELLGREPEASIYYGGGLFGLF